MSSCVPTLITQVLLSCARAITSALSAAADFGIPLTLREVSQGVKFATGHGQGAFSGEPHGDTLVYYMASTVLPALSDYLTDSGFPSDTPAAIVRNTGSALSDAVFTDIAGLKSVKTESPALIIVGKSVDLALCQPKYLFTGLEISRYSARPPGRMVHYPLIRTEEFLVPQPVDMNKYDAVIFTSRTAVRAFFRRYALSGQTVFAIGPSTAEELRHHGVRNAVVQAKHNSGALADAFREYKFEHVLYPCSKQSDNPLHELPQVETLALYSTSDRVQPKIELTGYEGVVFTSPSTVASFARQFGEFPENLLYYCIGPITAKRLLETGVREEIVIDVSEISTEAHRP